MNKKLLVFIGLIVLPALLWAKKDKEPKTSKKFRQEQLWALGAQDFIKLAIDDSLLYSPFAKTRLDTLYKKKGVNVNYTEEFAYHTLRENDLEAIRLALKKHLVLRKWQKLHIKVDGLPLEQYVPVYYATEKDEQRINTPYTGTMNVKNLSKSYDVSLGLGQRHIALWNSHGRYYKREEDCWKWQRAPLFTSVEDLFTSSYVLPFLVPMLENAGANVYLPRERDVQINEVIVDNADAGFSVSGAYFEKDSTGFKKDVTLDSSFINPFTLGTYGVLQNGTQVEWKTDVPKTGKYAVYVSYVTLGNSVSDAHYELIHAGDTTEFCVNQQMGGGTWIYLGHFFFDKNVPAKIILRGSGDGFVTADAVRFGGGMGDIPRGGKVSGVPRWQEAARYYLQYSGALDTLTFNLHGDTVDYNDDFRSRSRWVNYLRGGESVEEALRGDTLLPGFGIPIDLSLGLHTDAGHFPAMDTTVGTLAIYSTYDVPKNREFYYGKSRLLNRDLADLMQTQIVEDIRALYQKDWTQRELWDKMYSEATFAQVPSLLLELHGHSNALDMRYGLDPQFRFDASRAMYKAVLRFLSAYYQEDYVVQPLPVSNFCMEKAEDKLWLKWETTKDTLEPTACPDSFVVYRRKNGLGWDNGVMVGENSYEINVADTALWSYKVTAVNSGGESFPSTILTTVKKDDDVPTVLVVDGFSRVAAPFFIEQGDSVGVAPWLDEGVPYETDIATIGWQYEYDQRVPWQSDDIPGHGGSFQDLSSALFVGNNFDHSYVHTQTFAALGYNVVSATMDAVEAGLLKLEDYDLVDIIYGEQRSDVYPSGQVRNAIYTPKMMQVLVDYTKHDDAKLIISGAHIAADAYADTTAQILNERVAFMRGVLGYDWEGQKYEEGAIFLEADTMIFKYNTDYSQKQYRVENVDILRPAPGSTVIYDYYDNQGAVTYFHPYYKVISSAVPFEAIITEKKRLQLMQQWLEYMFE